MAFKFDKLEVWQLALEMANNIHLLTRSFPKEEMFSLTSQIKRAADSISLNIAEGSTGQSDAEQHRFLGYAQRSALEVVGAVHLSLKRDYISKEIFDIHHNQLIILVKRIQSFKNSFKK
ncbi:MAG: four helix bundle protein [Ferruginibacter sp.]